MQPPVYRQSKLSEISPEWKEFTTHFSVPDFVGTPAELRKIKLPRDNSPPVGLTIKQVEISGYMGVYNQVRIYVPESTSAPLAVVIYIHGGGWTIGDLDTEDRICRTLCKSNQAVVVSVDYRKAPENPFPIGLEDVWAGVLWVFDNIEFLGGRRDRVVLGGLSAGANMVAVLSQRARDHESIPICGQILRNPLVVHPRAHPADMNFSSYEENIKAPLLPTPAVAQFLNYYNSPPQDVRISPLLANDLTGLPPAYIQIAGADPIRDDGFAYADKLQKAGVPVRTNVYPGLPHGFMNLPLESSRRSDEDLVEALKWLIDK